MLLQRLKYKFKFINRVGARLRSLRSNIKIDSKNIIAWGISFAVLFAVTYNSFQSISQWSIKYQNIKQEAQDFRELEEKKQSLEEEIQLLQDKEYTRIKASDSNLTNNGETIYRIIDNTPQLANVEEEEIVSRYIPEKGFGVWLDLILD